MLVYLRPDANCTPIPNLEEVSGFKKIELLAPSTMDTRFRGKGRSEQQFAFITDVAKRLPMYQLRYRPYPEAVRDMARLILELVSRQRP
jgi:hypothetical protein